jgi:hypothetical protein
LTAVAGFAVGAFAARAVLGGRIVLDPPALSRILSTIDAIRAVAAAACRSRFAASCRAFADWRSRLASVARAASSSLPSFLIVRRAFFPGCLSAIPASTSPERVIRRGTVALEYQRGRPLGTTCGAVSNTLASPSAAALEGLFCLATLDLPQSGARTHH